MGEGKEKEQTRILSHGDFGHPRMGVERELGKIAVGDFSALRASRCPRSVNNCCQGIGSQCLSSGCNRRAWHRDTRISDGLHCFRVKGEHGDVIFTKTVTRVQRQFTLGDCFRHYCTDVCIFDDVLNLFARGCFINWNGE